MRAARTRLTPTPVRAVNERTASGEIPKTRPFVCRESVKALKGRYSSQEAAADAIARSLREFYRTQAVTRFSSEPRAAISCGLVRPPRSTPHVCVASKRSQSPDD
jgi:hypothetical protein